MAKKKKAPLAESAEWQQQSPPDPHDDQRSPLELAHLQMAKSMASIPDIKEEEELLGRYSELPRDFTSHNLHSPRVVILCHILSFEVLCWKKSEVKGCVIKTVTHAIFDNFFWSSRVGSSAEIAAVKSHHTPE